MVILGGMGNTVGVIIAAVLLTLLPEFLRRRGISHDHLSCASLLTHPAQLNRSIPHDHLFAADSIVLMLTRPQGLVHAS